MDTLTDLTFKEDTPIADKVKALNEGGVTVLACGHCLHKVCFNEMVQHAPSHNHRCPTCRRAFSYTSAASQNLFA